MSLIRNYEPKSLISVIYMGGDVVFPKSEKFFICSCDENANIVDYQTSEFLSSLQGDSYVISLAINPNGKYLAMSCRSQNIFVWNLAKKIKYRSIRNDSPVISLDYDPSGTLLAFGQGDHTVKVYDFENNYVTHHFKGHTSRVHLVKFHPDSSKYLLFTCSQDGVRCWNLRNRKCIAHFTDHSENITDMTFSADGKILVTSGLDEVLNIYSIENLGLLKTIPLYESIQSICFVPKDEQKDEEYLVTIGSKNNLRKWDYEQSDCIQELKLKSPVSKLLYMKNEENIFCISEENNFFFYNFKSLEEKKHILGFNDEIVDLSYIGKKTQKIIIATNSDFLTIFDLETKNTEILKGHKDVILSVSSTSDSKYFVSGAKDDTIRVWEIEKMRCIAIGDSHTAPITSVCVSPNNEFFCSVSDDKTLKKWQFKPVKSHTEKHKKTNGTLKERDILPLNAETCVAHAKDITEVSISPNSELIATSSVDKTVKIFNAYDLQKISEFTHKAAVWCVAFSNVEKCIATGANDRLIRIWSLTSGTCIKVLEGHTKSVMKVKYINNGTQLLSVGSDGLTKIWNLKTNECEATFDEHSERIWSLDVRKDGEEFITGGEDSKIVLWKENTQIIAQEEQKLADDEILKDQQIKNLVRGNNFKEAVLTAITLERPRLLFDLIQKIDNLDEIIDGLSHEQITHLFQYSIDWNTNSRFSDVAQKILFSILKKVDPSFVSFAYEKSVDSLIAYSRRHLKRMESLLERSYFMDYLLTNMNLLIPTESDEDSESSSLLKNKPKTENFSDVVKVKFVEEKSDEKLKVEKMIQESFEDEKNKEQPKNKENKPKNNKKTKKNKSEKSISHEEEKPKKKKKL
eukprot:gene36-4287_t